MAKTMDEVLSGKAAETPVEKPEPAVAKTPEPEVKAEPKEEAKTERARDESGKFAKGEKQSESPSDKTSRKSEPDDPETGLKAGITAERKKRQAVESRLREMEQQLAALQQPRQTPDVLGDPQGYAQHVRTEVENALLDERVNLSVDFARDRHEDFEAVMGPEMENWTEAISADPTLYQRAIGQRNPGEWAYQYLKREKAMSEIGDPENWKKQQLEALRKELEPQLRRELEAAMPKPATPPPSLAAVASGGRVNADTNGVERKPFDQIFPRH